MSSTARRTNRLLVWLAGVTLIVASGVAVFGDPKPRSAFSQTSTSTPTSSTSTSSTSTTIEKSSEFEDGGDYVAPFDDEYTIFSPGFTIQKDKSVTAGSSYWLDESIPTRPAAILPNEFTYGKSSTMDLMGSERETLLHDFNLKASGSVACPKGSTYFKKPDDGSKWSEFETCSVLTTEYGKFLVTARSAWLNYMDQRLKDAIKIEIFVPRTFSDGTRRAVQVLSGYFGQSLCAGRRYIKVGKAKVGRNDVLVISDIFDDFLSTRTTIVAMSSSGMPIVVASYVAEGDNETAVASSDRSLIILNRRVGDLDDQNFEEFTLTELTPKDPQWLERVHVAKSPNDRIVTQFWSSPKPHNILEYDFRTYDDERSYEWCARQK